MERNICKDISIYKKQTWTCTQGCDIITNTDIHTGGYKDTQLSTQHFEKCHNSLRCQRNKESFMNSHISPQLCQVSPPCPKCPVGKTENKKIRYKEIRRLKDREEHM